VQRRFFLPALAAVLAAGLAFAACSNQSEGDRCDHTDDNGGADDCKYPLTCQGKGSFGDVCCPPPGGQATTAICAGTVSTGDAGSAIEAGASSDGGDAGEGGAQTSDASDAGDAGDASDTGASQTTDASDASDAG
jgi:hypothetical protein